MNIPSPIQTFLGAVLLGGVVVFAVSVLVKQVEPRATSGEVSELRQHFSSLIQENPQEAYRMFKREYAQEPFGIQHNAAHIFGESLYETLGLSGVRTCDPEMNFGCFHGFFSKAVRVEGLDVVPSLDNECFLASGDRALACQHGLGHGIVEFVGTNNLDKALEACERTRRIDPIGGCTSGVFMEYNVPLVQAENGTYTLATRTLSDRGEPYDPCPQVGETFRLSCYHELPQWWVQVFSGEHEKIGALCAAIEDVGSRRACFSGAGNTMPASLNYALEASIAYCKTMPTSEGRSLCALSTAGAFRGNIGDAKSADAVCASIENDAPFQCVL